MSLSERTESTHPAPVAWGGILRWTGIVIGAVLLAALITLYFLDWNTMRGPIGRYASRHYGREVRIDGNLAVKLFTLQPSIDVGGLFIGNPGWEPRPFAANVQHARVELRLLPLFVGKLILPLVSIDKPQLLVVRAPDGRTNWDSTSGNSKPLNLPPIHRFLVRDGHVAIDDAIRKLSFTGTVNSSETRGAGAAFTLLYALIYVLMRLEDWALLVGAVTSFAAIAAVMYFTRRIDWYGVGERSGEGAA